MPNTNGDDLYDPLIRNQLAAQVANILTSRSEAYRVNRQEPDRRRNINDECGYPENGEVTVENYRELYDRESIATRVVQVLPRESWKVQPSVFEDEDINVIKPFEQAWIDLADSLRGPSWHQDEEGSPIWEAILRVDELSGIGSHGALLLGINDGLPLDQSIAGFEDGTPPEGSTTITRKLLFLRAFDESLARVTQLEEDKTNPRFGMPLQYSMSFSDPSQNQQIIAGHNLATATVHWSRVIHVADNLGTSEVFGVPRMGPVYNRLLDLRKLYGGMAEMYWKGAFPGISWETHPQLGPDVQIDSDDMKDQIEQLMNGLQRAAVTSGMTAKSLAPQVVDPTPQIEAAIQAICILTGIPKRIFTGSERGELASSEDKGTWNARLAFRQTMYLTPRVIVPFVDRLIQIGVLPVPKGYSVVWPDLNALTADEQATVAVKVTESLAKYVAGNVESVMTLADYLTRVLGRTKDEAEEIIKAVMEEEERLTPDAAEIAQEEAEKGREFAAEGQERAFEREDEKEKNTDKET